MHQSTLSREVPWTYSPTLPSTLSSRLRAQHRELKLKHAALEKDYADLHTALFEAAQVHRRLCAPRLVRHGDVEIASEIFAVRYLPGDFFTIEEAGGGVIIALGRRLRQRPGGGHVDAVSGGAGARARGREPGARRRS